MAAGIDTIKNFDLTSNIDQIADKISAGILSKIEIQVALLGILSVIISAVLQYLFTKASEKSQQLAVLRNESYVDYLSAIAKAAHGASSHEKNSAILEATDAKARIAIYGSSQVILALAELEKTGARLNNDHSNNCFLTLVNAMRTENEVSSDTLSQILLGTKVKH